MGDSRAVHAPEVMCPNERTYEGEAGELRVDVEVHTETLLIPWVIGHTQSLFVVRIQLYSTQ